jgi:hypothetical protein
MCDQHNSFLTSNEEINVNSSFNRKLSPIVSKTPKKVLISNNSFIEHSKSPCNKNNSNFKKEVDCNYLETDGNINNRHRSKIKLEKLSSVNVKSLRLKNPMSPLILKNKSKIEKENKSFININNKFSFEIIQSQSYQENKLNKSDIQINNKNCIGIYNKIHNVLNTKKFKLKIKTEDGANKLKSGFKFFRPQTYDKYKGKNDLKNSCSNSNYTKINSSALLKDESKIVKSEKLVEENLNTENEREVKENISEAKIVLSKMNSGLSTNSNEQSSLQKINPNNNHNSSNKNTADDKRISSANKKINSDNRKGENRIMPSEKELVFDKKLIYACENNLLVASNKTSIDNFPSNKQTKSFNNITQNKNTYEEGIEDIHFKFVKYIKKSKNITKLHEFNATTKVSLEFNTVIEFDEVNIDDFVF